MGLKPVLDAMLCSWARLKILYNTVDSEIFARI